MLLNFQLTSWYTAGVLIPSQPTAGMDPVTRRKVWALLQTGKAERCTLLTTREWNPSSPIALWCCVIS